MRRGEGEIQTANDEKKSSSQEKPPDRHMEKDAPQEAALWATNQSEISLMAQENATKLNMTANLIRSTPI